MELSSQGHSEREIAERLQPLAICTVHRDLVYIKGQAQENIQHHIFEEIPMELERCRLGVKGNLKHVLEIGETATDPKIKLQARAIANDCYMNIRELCSDSNIVSGSLKKVSELMRKQSGEISQLVGKDEEEEKEGVF